MGAGDVTTIRRLELRTANTDALAARLQVERLLGMVDLRPRSLAPAAILCVRELRDPLPGTLAIDRWLARPPPAWEQAVQRELDRLARAAAWPARDAVPATAEAVAFGDEAELLACLGGDLAAGGLPARWWWPLLLGGIGEPRRAVAAAWLSAAAHAPAALQRLAERRQAEPFVRALPPADRTRLTAAVEARFALPPPAPRPEGARPPSVTEPPPPWRGWVEEAERPGLARDEQALLGIALSIVRAPQVVRSAAFAAALHAWRAHVPAAQDEAWARASPAPALAVEAAARWSSPSSRAAAGAVEPLPARAEVILADAPPVVGRGLPSVGKGGAGEARVASAPGDAEAPPLPPAASSGESAPAPRPHVAPGPLAETPVASSGEAAAPRWSAPASDEPRLPWQPRTRAFGAPVDTALGGLFYLVNVALSLGLYRERDRDDRDELALPLWDFVTLMGRRLLGTRGADDPVWSLLDALAGREAGEAPGAGFTPPPDWRLPAAWLAPFPPSTPRCLFAGGRLRIEHADGFTIVDVADVIPPGTEATARAARELEGYGRLAAPVVVAGTADLVPGAPLDLWVERVTHYLIARLRRALDPDTDDAAALAELLLAHSARVHVTDTHLDVVQPLERLPVAIRFAGLDRDPGWVPAAGRFIAFHFE